MRRRARGMARGFAGATVGRVDKGVELEFMVSSGLLCVVRPIHLYMRKRREKSIWPSEKKFGGPNRSTANPAGRRAGAASQVGGADAAAPYPAERMECAGLPALWRGLGCRMPDA